MLPDPSSAASLTSDATASRSPKRRRLGRLLLIAIMALWAGSAYWESHKPLAPGMHVAADWSDTPAAGVSFVPDITTADAYGRPVLSHPTILERKH